jgi:hypothetical protein
MTDFSLLYEQYLHKLVLNKPYKLGDICDRLIKLKVDCDVVALYLQLYASDKFVAQMVDDKWENILVTRIND